MVESLQDGLPIMEEWPGWLAAKRMIYSSKSEAPSSFAYKRGQQVRNWFSMKMDTATKLPWQSGAVTEVAA